MSLRDVVDELLDDDRLADTRAAEETDLPALHERRYEIDDFDAGLEDFRLRLERYEVRPLAMNRPTLDVVGDRRPVVHGLAEHVEDAPKRRRSDGHFDRRAGVDHFHASNRAVGGRHRHRA